MSSPDAQPIRFPCLRCGKFLAAPEHLIGTEQTCPHCQQLVTVPRQTIPSSAISPVQPVAPPPRIAVNATNRAEIVRQKAGEISVQKSGESDEMWAPGEAAPAEQQAYVPVHCRVCYTRMYATVAEVGSDVVCPDCGAKTKVKMVATKQGQVPPITVPGDGYELSAPPPALTMELVGYGTPVATLNGTRSQQQALRESAEKYVANRKRRKPPKLWMLRGVFLYPFSLSVLPMVVAIAMVCPAAYYIVRLIDFMSSSPVMAAGSVFLVLVSAALIGMAMSYLATLLLAVVEVSSDGGENVAGEFDLMFADRMFRGMYLAAAWVYALAPGEIVNAIFGSPESWQLIKSSPLNYPSLVSLFLLLPITQLSVLEASSMVVPLSYNLLRGIRRNLFAWVAFYVVASLIFPATLALLVLVTEFFSGYFLAWGISFVTLFATVIYYRLLGRLAWYSAENTQALGPEPPAGPYAPLYP